MAENNVTGGNLAIDLAPSRYETNLLFYEFRRCSRIDATEFFLASFEERFRARTTEAGSKRDSHRVHVYASNGIRRTTIGDIRLEIAPRRVPRERCARGTKGPASGAPTVRKTNERRNWPAVGEIVVRRKFGEECREDESYP